MKIYCASFVIGFAVLWYFDRKDENNQTSFFDFFHEDWFMRYFVSPPLIGFIIILILGVIISFFGGNIYIGRY